MRQWLPNVIQAVEPFMSEYIEKGKTWPENLDANLHESDVGLICLTRENLTEPWIQFEAGALYMQLAHERVCPYVLDLPLSEIPWPLARFQATKAEKADTRKLLDAINKALDKNALNNERLTEAFEIWWPKLQEKILEAEKLPEASKPARRDAGEILEELVSLVRSQSRQIEDLENDIAPMIQQLDVTLIPRIVSTSGGATGLTGPSGPPGYIMTGPGLLSESAVRGREMAARALVRAALEAAKLGKAQREGKPGAEPDKPKANG